MEIKAYDLFRIEGSSKCFTYKYTLNIPPKVKVQLALLFSSFVHNSSINELKNMKLSEHICYEMIN